MSLFLKLLYTSVPNFFWRLLFQCGASHPDVRYLNLSFTGILGIWQVQMGYHLVMRTKQSQPCSHAWSITNTLELRDQ